MRITLTKFLPGALASLAMGVAAWGQSAPPLPPPGVEVGPDLVFSYVGLEQGPHGKVVKGAPYSAQLTTETTQTLADGTHIARTSTGLVYRDSEGRTRRERSLTAIGPLSAGGEVRQLISIHDPVAGVHYVLEPDQKIARKMTEPSGEKMTALSGEPWAQKRVLRGPLEAGPGAPPPQQESLGTQTMEGLAVEGTRTTFTIPTGQVGNDRPIVVVSERWYSPDLQTVVMSKHSDPRMGETVFHLTNISRAEPAASLFAVPADYTVKEGHEFGGVRIIKHGPPPDAPPPDEDN